MTKTAATSAITGAQFMAGHPIYAADALEVVEQLNWSAGENPHQHMNLITGDSGWGSSGNEIATHSASFSTGSGLTENYSGNIWLDPDVQSVKVAAQCTFPASPGTDDGQVKFTIGSGTATLDFTAATTSEDSGSITIASIGGTGWVAVTIETNHTAGSAATCTLDWVLIEEEPIAATDLPDPADE